MGTKMILVCAVRMGHGRYPCRPRLLSRRASCVMARSIHPQPEVYSEKKTGAYGSFFFPFSSSSSPLVRVFPLVGAPPPRFFAANAGLSLDSVDAPFRPPRVLLPRHTPALCPRPRPPRVPPRATVDMVATRWSSMRACVEVMREMRQVGVYGGRRCEGVEQCVRPAQAESWLDATGGRAEETKKCQGCREESSPWPQLKAAGKTSRAWRPPFHWN